MIKVKLFFIKSNIVITPHFRGNYITNFGRKEGGNMDYEKVNKAIVEILEEKYGVKIESKVERKWKRWVNKWRSIV